MDMTKPDILLTLEEVRELRFGDVLLAWFTDDTEPHQMIVVEDVSPTAEHEDVMVRFADCNNAYGNHRIQTKVFEYWGSIRLVPAPSTRPFTVGDRVVFAAGCETQQHEVTASNLYKDGIVYYQLDGGKLSNVPHDALRIATVELEMIQPINTDTDEDDEDDDFDV
jgi:hypothetical protein